MYDIYIYIYIYIHDIYVYICTQIDRFSIISGINVCENKLKIEDCSEMVVD